VPAAAYVWLGVFWVAWFLPFALLHRKASKPGAPGLEPKSVIVDRRARWGIALQGVGYMVLWQGRFWAFHPSRLRMTASVVLLAVACLLSWSGARALGRQFRVDAGLNREHELVQRGPYRLIRHPIYASMLCLLLGTGAILTPVWLFAAAVAIFVAGTEIRVRIEDALLTSRFGEAARAYQRSVAAYVPFVR